MAGFRPSTPFYTAIQRLGLTTNLSICLDAGDSASYNGSSQTWTDLSGNGYSFFRGNTSGSEGNDPTFNGSAGGLSTNEYFSSDGDDVFTINQSNPAAVNNIHKVNATFTIIVWAYMATLPGTAGSPFYLMSSTDGSKIGFSFLVNTSNNHQFVVYRTDLADLALNVGGGSLASLSGQWVMHSIRLVESPAPGTRSMGANTTFSTSANANYSSPSSNNASGTLQIGGRGAPNNFNPMTSGNRVAFAALWGGTALTTAQITSFYNYTNSMVVRSHHQINPHIWR